MSIELKGLYFACIAALLTLGAMFGMAAIVSHQASPPLPLPDALQTTVAAGADSGAGDSDNSTVAHKTVMTSHGAVGGASGAQLFAKNCASCHGKDASGAMGPDLRGMPDSNVRIAATVRHGKRKMPAFDKKFTTNQINAVVSYIKSLKEPA